MTEYRFGNIERIYADDGTGVQTLYLTRLHLGPFFLHFFTRGDMDRHPHDHPWDFWTFPLTTYYEEVWTIWRGCIEDFKERNKVQRFRFHFRPARYAHRVLHPAPGTQIITLVWHGRKKRSWGFWVNGEWLHHRKYIGGNDA